MNWQISRIPGFCAAFVGVTAFCLEAQKVDLDWATYFGGGDLERVGRVAVDNDGNPLLYGESFSSVSHNCGLDNHSGGDAVFASIHSEGDLLSICRISGKRYSEAILGAVQDADGSWYFCGGTESSSGIATEGAHQTSFAIGKGQKYLSGKGADGYLVKISAQKEIAWGTYYGGKERDQATGVVVDNQGNVHICGLTTSFSHVATEGAHQEKMDPESDDFESKNIWTDGFLAKFTPTGERIWGTYYGGNRNDEIKGMAVDPDGDYIYVVGSALSASGIATRDAHKEQVSLMDAFVAKFDKDGQRIWGTYFGGDEMERGEGIAVDEGGNVYICGLTASDNIADEKVVNAAGGDRDGFVAAFSPEGALLWARYIGGSKRESANAVACGNGRVYVAGSTNSSSGIAFNGFKSSRGDVYHTDALIVAVNSADGAGVWGSYYGGEANDIGKGIAVGAEGEIYLSGTTRSTNGVAREGGFLQAAPGEGNLFLARISDELETATCHTPVRENASNVLDLVVNERSLEIAFEGNKSTLLRVYNARGRELMRKAFASSSAHRKIVSIPFEQTSTGTYFITLQNGTDFHRSRIVIP